MIRKKKQCSLPICSSVDPFIPEEVAGEDDVAVARTDLGVDHVHDQGLGDDVAVQQAGHHTLNDLGTNTNKMLKASYYK